MGPSSVTVEQEGGQVREGTFSYSALFHGARDTGAPCGHGEKALCLRAQAFQGLLQKVGGAQSTEGAFCHWQFALGQRERERAGATARRRVPVETAPAPSEN